MDAGQITTRELTKYWDAIGENDQNIAVLQGWRMPPWNDICAKLPWEKYLLGGGYWSKKNHGFAGVYRLIALETNGDKECAAPLSRLLGIDTSGTLYVGEATMLHERLNQMRRRRPTHNAIAALANSSLSELFPNEKLAVAILRTDGRMREWIEKDLIRAYMKSFGDTPPLNLHVSG